MQCMEWKVSLLQSLKKEGVKWWTNRSCVMNPSVEKYLLAEEKKHICWLTFTPKIKLNLEQADHLQDNGFKL